ncbi:MAG: type II toxin-antitoxin system mRNA interferase toxin, RelE/StbE family [Alphaproteobacteria bacterium]|nr:type II toxin-antitoxin system mRNA interferase toxin, RelE/StbE family [Alphaproteobacteria bacterium]
MIISFQHKGLQKLYEKNEDKGIGASIRKRVHEALTMLDNVDSAEDMNIPGYRLHKLTGDLKGYWSIAVSANWRIIFRFEGKNAADVDLIDYH